MAADPIHAADDWDEAEIAADEARWAREEMAPAPARAEPEGPWPDEYYGERREDFPEEFRDRGPRTVSMYDG